MLFLFILFVVLPITEIMVIINVSDSIGGWNTFALVVFTAFLGAFFVKREGIATLQKVQLKASQGDLPGKELIEGIMLLVAGVLLVTPGFITDILGLAFTFPVSRKLIAASFLKHLIEKQQQGQSSFYFQFNQTRTGGFNQPGGGASGFDSSGSQSGETIEGEYQDKSDNDDKNRLN
ncbi:FxsA family protein [Glaciecola sp. 1036]|uniref:FxsA family protein n=1 Tax=Alteromonadaceae TaxID=72275 RepID=UPI003D0216F3